MKKKWRILALCVILATGAGVLAWELFFERIHEIKEMAVEPVDLSRASDGIHDGSFQTPYKAYHVKVSIMNHKITHIEIFPGDGYFTFYDREAESMIRGVLARQNLDVDAVTGATVTCKAVLKAMENALSPG